MLSSPPFLQTDRSSRPAHPPKSRPAREWPCFYCAVPTCAASPRTLLRSLASLLVIPRVRVCASWPIRLRSIDLRRFAATHAASLARAGPRLEDAVLAAITPDGLASDMKPRIPWRAAERRLRRMMAVARIETLRLVRDRVAISLIAVVPAVQIVLFGYAVNLDPKDVPIAIAGSDGSLVERAARIVGETGYFKIVGEGLPSGAAERMVTAGRALVGIELPPSPDEEGTGDAPPPRARVVVDATDPAVVRPALAALETAYWRKRATTFSLDDGAAIDVDWLYNPRATHRVDDRPRAGRRHRHDQHVDAGGADARPRTRARQLGIASGDTGTTHWMR